MHEEDEHFLNASRQKCILLSGTECHIINYLLTELARAVLGNIGPRSFLYGPRCARSVLSQPRANIPQYGPRARLVRGYYYHFVGHCGAFCGLKWRISRAKMYFSPLK